MKDIIFPYSRGFEQLICFLIIGGGMLAVLSVGMLLLGIKNKKRKKYFFCWGAVFIVAVLSLSLGLIFSKSGRYTA